MKHLIGKITINKESGGEMTENNELTWKLREKANKHLWMPFARHSIYSSKVSGNELPIILQGKDCYVWDSEGNKYFDGLSGLFVVQLGHGREEIAETAREQTSKLGFFPIWGYGNQPAIELAEKLAGYAPEGLNKVFFTSSGGEAVESAWKLAKQYYKLTGKPGKYKVISREIAYHGTPQGALTITGIEGIKAPFEPLVPGGVKVPNTNMYRHSLGEAVSEEEFGKYYANKIVEAIEREGADTVAAVFIEPVQNAGGCFPPPAGYLNKVREICDTYDILLVADETITGFGRTGGMFAVNRYGVTPDIITCAKGMTSGYAPMGAMIVSDKLFEPFSKDTTMFLHGYTWSGHPVGAAVALKNLEIFERENIIKQVQDNEEILKTKLEALYDLPIVGDVRGAGYFWGIELVKNKKTKETFTEMESENLLRGFLSKELFTNGLYCRADDRGDPVVQLAMPLITTTEQFDEIAEILRNVLTKASDLI